MSIAVKLQAFEGPLDLLLHLIDKNKINIYDIPIAEITEQYMEYVRAMEEKDMNVMSEFLVMAATLLNIKSQMLLPKDENISEEEKEDPRRELVERLLEYKMFKYVSDELKGKQIDASRLMFKEPTIPEEIAEYKEVVHIEDLLNDLTLAKLQDIFQSVIKKQADKIDPIRSTFGKIEKEEINLSDKILYIELYGQLHKKFSFKRILEKQNSKMEVIVTFLGVLELMKMGHISIVQKNIFDDILISYNNKSEPIGELFFE